MRFEGKTGGIRASDYRQFADFLGLNNRQGYTRQPPREMARQESMCAQSPRPIAMVYGVEQCFVNVYDPEVALGCGTVFEELNKPFYPTGCKPKSGEGCL